MGWGSRIEIFASKLRSHQYESRREEAQDILEFMRGETIALCAATPKNSVEDLGELTRAVRDILDSIEEEAVMRFICEQGILNGGKDE